MLCALGAQQQERSNASQLGQQGKQTRRASRKIRAQKRESGRLLWMRVHLATIAQVRRSFKRPYPNEISPSTFIVICYLLKGTGPISLKSTIVQS